MKDDVARLGTSFRVQVILSSSGNGRTHQLSLLPEKDTVPQCPEPLFLRTSVLGALLQVFNFRPECFQFSLLYIRTACNTGDKIIEHGPLTENKKAFEKHLSKQNNTMLYIFNLCSK